MTSPKQADELLSCPFCGGNRLFVMPVANTGGHRQFVWCEDCSTGGPWSSLASTATQLWNQRARLSSPSVPETHVIVPKEATEAMQSAYFDSIDKYLPRVQTDPLFGRYKNFRIAYQAMLAAAQPPSAPPEAGKVQGIKLDESLARNIVDRAAHLLSTHEDSDGTGYCRGCGTTIGELHHADCDLRHPSHPTEGLVAAAYIVRWREQPDYEWAEALYQTFSGADDCRRQVTENGHKYAEIVPLYTAPPKPTAPDGG